MKTNTHGFYGFLLSLLQLFIHAGWLLFVAWLAETEQAEQLDARSWQMWVIVSLIVAGSLCTAVSLFLCLYGAIHGRPKIPALIGLCLSFFVGATTTFVLLLNLLRG